MQREPLSRWTSMMRGDEGQAFDHFEQQKLGDTRTIALAGYLHRALTKMEVPSGATREEVNDLLVIGASLPLLSDEDQEAMREVATSEEPGERLPIAEVHLTDGERALARDLLGRGIPLLAKLRSAAVNELRNAELEAEAARRRYEEVRKTVSEEDRADADMQIVMEHLRQDALTDASMLSLAHKAVRTLREDVGEEWVAGELGAERADNYRDVMLLAEALPEMAQDAYLPNGDVDESVKVHLSGPDRRACKALLGHAFTILDELSKATRTGQSVPERFIDLANAIKDGRIAAAPDGVMDRFESLLDRADAVSVKGDTTAMREATVPLLYLADVNGAMPDLWISTSALVRLSERARLEGLPDALTESYCDGLMPGLRHVFMEVWKDQTETQSYARCRALVGRSGPEDPEDAVFTLPLDAVGKLLATQYVRDGNVQERSTFERQGMAHIAKRIAEEKPMWLGAPGFDLTWKACARAAELAAAYLGMVRRDEEKKPGGLTAFKQQSPDAWFSMREALFDPRGMVALDTLERMRDAHVMQISPKWVDVLPGWESAEEMWMFAQRFHLPFNPLYLDLSLDGMVCSTAEVRLRNGETERLDVAGALLWRDEQPEDSAELPPLHMTLMGWPESARFHPEDALTSGKIPIAFTPTARVTFGGSTPFDIEYRRMAAPNLPGAVAVPVVAAASGLGERYWPEDPGSMPEAERKAAQARAVAALPGSLELLLRSGDEDEMADRGRAQGTDPVMGMATVMLRVAATALKALALLEVDAAGVAPVRTREVTRQEKRALKRGWEHDIAKTITITLPRQLREASQPTGNRREYSHAFDRAGGYAFYPLGTRLGDSCPTEKLVMHQIKGPCRKVWRKPTIVGLRDGVPYVPTKTRVVSLDPLRDAVSIAATKDEEAA